MREHRTFWSLSSVFSQGRGRLNSSNTGWKTAPLFPSSCKQMCVRSREHLSVRPSDQPARPPACLPPCTPLRTYVQCACVYTCLHTHIHTCLYMPTHVSTYVYMCPNMLAHVCTHMSTCMPRHRPAHRPTHMSTHMPTPMPTDLSAHLPWWHGAELLFEFCLQLIGIPFFLSTTKLSLYSYGLYRHIVMAYIVMVSWLWPV